MELQSGFPLLWQQYSALFKKNFILSWRNKRATFLQLFSSFFFIFLMFCIDKVTESQEKNEVVTASDVKDPKGIYSPPIPPCEDKVLVKKPCYDFVWSGSGNQRIEKIVDAIMANNPRRQIPKHKVKSFKTKDEVDKFLFKNPLITPGALHFKERNNSVISYGLQTSPTPPEISKGRGDYEDPTLKYQIPLQIAAEREIARSLIGDTKFSWNVGIKEFAHPAGDKSNEKDITADAMKSTFFLAMAMFGFVFQISSLVTEKELKLRQAMSMMGLYDSAYWLSWLSWEGIMTLISSILVVLFGLIFRLKFFTKNNILVVFFVFLLFQLNMTGFSFMMSTFISKSSSATTMGFSIFIVGILTQVATQAGFPYGNGGSKLGRRLWSLFPPNLLTQGLKLLTSDPDNGITWANRAKCLKTEPKCSMTINDVYIWLLGTFFVWLLLTLYFDNILPNPAGIRRSVYYFVMPGYWTGRGGNKLDEGGLCSCTGSIPPLEHTTPDDEDVLQEETAVKTQAKEGLLDPKIAVQIRGLVKAYPGTTTCVCCCKCKKTPPYHAVKGLWVNIEQDQLFCLLGPNGAGKTTTISCLTGIAPVTGGDALIHGFSIRSTSGAANIRRIIGVCPQFDILWEVLTSQEHLHLFANIKGLQPDSIDSVAMNLLSEVKLSEKAKTRAGSYSGGMKRRLSVAIALIGDPKLVILDEPTTGMDPITRRHVWDVIESAKKGRAIVLTTHSMEEADILSDRIAIMAKGRLRCIGSSIRLKSRFGTGFIANVTFIENLGQGRYEEDLDANRDAVKHFFNYHLSILPKEESKSFLTFVIPRDRERRLTEFFTALQEREKEFGIADIQLGLTTLEEVFLNIARQADLENAIAEGRMVSLTLDSGFQLEVPLGARYVAIPGKETPENPKGYMVEVYWEADDSGTLHITGHSQERPVPSSVQLRSSAPQLPRRNSLDSIDYESSTFTT